MLSNQKVVLITGASSGVGQTTARLLTAGLGGGGHRQQAAIRCQISDADKCCAMRQNQPVSDNFG